LSSFGRVVVNVIAGIYTILSTHFLAWLLVFAAIGLGFQLLARVIALSAGFADLDAMWLGLSARLGFSTLAVRLIVTIAFHGLLLLLLRRPFRRLRGLARRGFDAIEALFLRPDGRRNPLRSVAHLLFAIAVTLLIVPFFLQPTLVARSATDRWFQRLANLLDGTATLELTQSVPGYYRRWFFEPSAEGGVTEEEIDETIDHVDDPLPPPEGRSMIDRWDDHIRRSVGERADLFAVVKAFMFVESAGRQFAVSRTGCAGLMQFCVGTARSPRYRDIFGRGTVYPCACKSGECVVAREVQRDLELGRFEAVESDRTRFPCELTDARFVPERALAAGAKFIGGLHDALGGNIYLMYIGYNSGPRVAARVWKAVGEKPGATLAEIEPHLARALAPSFGETAVGRAHSLMRTHLPKIAAARDRYAPWAGLR
jgi:hypothetical protein